MLNNMKNFYNKGISLLEIIIVIAIIGILSAIVIPNLSFFKKEQALKNATVDIVSLLKETSILNNEAYYIITHRPEHIDTNEFNIIHLEKVNGLTIIK